jgi:sulfite exporter TauE/SafE/copper chaperone CopZ
MKGDEIKKFSFHVNGMHCSSCVLLVESKLKDVPYVKNVKADLSNFKAEVEGYFGDMNESEAAQILSKFISEHGYSLSPKKIIKEGSSQDFKIALPAAFGFVALFIALQKMGIINLVRAENLTYGTAFAIGVVASLSTCMAVVGGLLLSMSATYAKTGDRLRPQALFHFGRLASFFVLGGVIGAIGSAFTLNMWGTFTLNVIIGLVMLALGLNLLGSFSFTRKFNVSMPSFISKRAYEVQKLNHALTPLLVGVATFFLPCGFTQSMQLYSLTLGSFQGGALTMLFFALGTLPVLAFISFGFYGVKPKFSGIVFKAAGIIIIFFAIINLIGSLAAIGIIPPLLNF